MLRYLLQSATVALAACGVVRAADPEPVAAAPAPAVVAAPVGPPIVVDTTTATAPPAITERAAGAVTGATTDVTAAGGCAGACGTLCGGGGAGGAGDAWLGAEWLYWHTSGQRLPPLARTSPITTPFNIAGTLAGPGETVAGGRVFNEEWRNGFRLTAGLWIGALHRVGFEGEFFFLGRSRTRQVVGPDNSQFIGRPYFETVQQNAGVFTPVAPFPAAQFVSLPGVVAGRLTAEITNEFSGAGAYVVSNLGCDPCSQDRLFLGYRYLNLTDTVFIRNDAQTVGGTFFQTDERFHVENHFNGVPIGVVCSRPCGQCFWEVRASVAVGATRTIIDVDGSTIVAAGDTATRSTGSLLALPSNIGRFTRDSFAVVPEVGLKAGVQVNSMIRVWAGYNFLYWSHVIRGGHVIDTRVNSTQLPNNGPVTGPLFPRLETRHDDFITHGAMLGLQIQF